MSEPQSFDPTVLKVLVVGDNAFERRVVMDLLIALGVKSIFTADDAVAAFAQLTLKKPDMVIADAEMQPFTGFMLAREIRAAPIASRTIPIILFTAETSADFAAMARAAGADEVLAKPVSAHALRVSLETAKLRPRDEAVPSLYRGPDRRRAALAGPRRRQTDRPRGALDPEGRAAILTGIDEARICCARWAETGDPAVLEAARAAIYRAAEAAAAADADAALTQALAGALRLVAAAKAGHADFRLLEVSLSAARAVLSAPRLRNAMREALADAVSEAAETRAISSD